MSNGEISRKDNTLRLNTEDGKKADIPIEKVYDIYVFSQVSLNSALLNLLSKYRVVLHFYNFYEYYIGSFYPKEQNLAGALIVKQVKYYTDKAKRCALAKKFVLGAAENILRTIKYYHNRGRDFSASIDVINNLFASLNQANDIESIMGVEGNIRKEYYGLWKDIMPACGL